MAGSAVAAQLRGLAALREWSDGEIRELARLGDHVELATGTYLAREGVPAHQAFLVMAGAVARTHDGKEIDSIGPGELVCELEPLTGSPASITSRAVTSVEVLVLSATAIVRMHRLRDVAFRGGDTS